MPKLNPPRPRRPGRPSRRGAPASARTVVLGDLMLDVVLVPERPLDRGTDVPGRVALVQGGSAANTARWLARLGAHSTFITAVGRDPAGRALVDVMRADGVQVRAVRVSGARTGRVGAVVTTDGERSFVADRGAADELGPDDVRAAWFSRADVLHLPAYSLLGERLGLASRRVVTFAREVEANLSVDLASIAPLMAGGRRAAVDLVEEVAPDLLFATAAEARALLGTYAVDGLLDLAPTVVVKRGPKGATLLARDGESRLRFEVATEHLRPSSDTTGAGDAFDAGFLVGWFAARAAGRSLASALQRAALAGHRAAARQLSTPRPELPLA